MNKITPKYLLIKYFFAIFVSGSYTLNCRGKLRRQEKT